MFKDVMISARVSGCKGDVKFAVSRPLMPFMATKLVAEDSYGGHGTLILGFYIDGKLITPKIPWYKRLWLKLRRRSLGIPTAAFAHGVLGNGIFLQQCPPNIELSVEIEFLSDGNWKGDFYGRTPVVVPERSVK
jgi:hypothetical protein